MGETAHGLFKELGNLISHFTHLDVFPVVQPFHLVKYEEEGGEGKRLPPE